MKWNIWKCGTVDILTCFIITGSDTRVLMFTELQFYLCQLKFTKRKRLFCFCFFWINKMTYICWFAVEKDSVCSLCRLLWPLFTYSTMTFLTYYTVTFLLHTTLTLFFLHTMTFFYILYYDLVYILHYELFSILYWLFVTYYTMTLFLHTTLQHFYTLLWPCVISYTMTCRQKWQKVSVACHPKSQKTS